MIELKHIIKEYQLEKEVSRVLDDINIEIRNGEFLGIIGSSGSGKSTLMHIIGLLDTPTSGQVIFEGQNVAEFSDKKLSQMRNHYVGFVFQQFNLINKLTVKENILLPAVYSHEKLNYKVNDYAEELLDKFGIAERKDYHPNKISGGQQQRVAIARALIMKPKVILADEPTGNLDSKTGKEILDLIENLNEEFGVTVVVVTHEAAVARRTTRQVNIKDGRIVKKAEN
jgi:ABC-type lipoprotein export system ATPase subunit